MKELTLHSLEKTHRVTLYTDAYPSMVNQIVTVDQATNK